MPGALFPVANRMLECMEDNYNLEFINVFHDNYCFIPTPSSLDLAPPLHDAYLNDYSDTQALIAAGSTTADKIDGSTANDVTTYGEARESQEHADINSSNVPFLVSLIEKNRSFSAPHTLISDRTFNFGQGEDGTIVDNRILNTIEVIEDGFLRVNWAGKIKYTDESTNPQNTTNSHYDLYMTRHCSFPAEIHVHSGGVLDVGDQYNGPNTATLHMTNGSTLRIGNGGRVTVWRDSKIEVKDGASIYIEPGGVLNMFENGTVTIYEATTETLTIDNDFDGIPDVKTYPQGQISVSEGAFIMPHFSDSRLIVNGKVTFWGGTDETPTYNHAGEGHIQINETAEFEAYGSTFNLQSGSNLHDMLRLGNNTQIDLPVGTNLKIEGTSVEIGDNAGVSVSQASLFIHGSKVDYGNDAELSTEFCDVNVTLSILSSPDVNDLGKAGISMDTPTNGVNLSGSIFQNFSQGIYLENLDPDVPFYAGHCFFTDNIIGLSTKNTNHKLSILECQFTNNVISSTGALFIDAQEPVTIRNSDFLGDLGLLAQVNTGNLFSQSVTNNGIQLENVRNLNMSGTSVSNCNIGINGINNINNSSTVNFFQNNMTLFDQTVIENNFVGIWTNGGVNQPTPTPSEVIDYGSVFFDCVTLANNQTGIKGTDILLQIDALENCGECIPESEDHRPNTFIKEKNTLYFDICLEDRADTYSNGDVSARGNYWDDDAFPVAGAAPPHYLIEENCDLPGSTTLSLDYSGFVTERPRGCNPYVEPTGPQIPPGDACDNMYVTPTGGNPTIVPATEKHHQGIKKLYDEDLPGAVTKLTNTANISDTDRASAADKCRTKIDFARTYVPRSVAMNPYIILPDDGTNTIDNPHGILISPNPGEGDFRIKTKGGDFTLYVFDVFGKLIVQSGFNDTYRLNLQSFTDGVYFVKVNSKNGNDDGTSVRLIKQ